MKAERKWLGSALRTEIEAERRDPNWLAGFRDGQASRAVANGRFAVASSPDMSRGHGYALGWLTGALLSEPSRR